MKGPFADRASLEDMLSYSARARRHVTSFESLRDETVCHAALYELAIVGEAANRLSSQLRDAHPEVPWRYVIAFRNILIHLYDEIDLNRVWDAVERLPEFEAQVRAILDELPE